MNYKLTTLFTLIVLLTGAIGAYGYVSRARNGEIPPATSTTSPATSNECNRDSHTCEDGTLVGRVGPTCEFSACPDVFPAKTPQFHATGILYGKVTLSPVCPVESLPLRPECAPKPFVTELRVYTSNGKDTGTATRTREDGVFVLDLFPGNYIIRAASGAVYPRCEEVQVSISANSSTSISLSCDSGIR